MGAIENTLKSWFARIPWTKMLPIHSFFIFVPWSYLFTSQVHRYWKLSFLLNLESLLPRIYKCYLSQSLQTADSCRVSSCFFFPSLKPGEFPPKYSDPGIFTFQVGPLGGGWWNKGHSKQVRWRRLIQEDVPFFSHGIFWTKALINDTSIRWTAKIPTFKRTCVSFLKPIFFFE